MRGISGVDLFFFFLPALSSTNFFSLFLLALFLVKSFLWLEFVTCRIFFVVCLLL